MTPTTAKSQFAFRGAQLDLARQMETVDFIRDFIDLLAENGLNTVFLYLEGRIRTKSFPYPKDDECYTPEQIGHILAHARKRNIEVVPGVSLHGHAEMFLKHPEMEPLAELRDGRTGRFGRGELRDFCPLSEATERFFENYLSEICPLFPSRFFHIGCDEVWDVGYCPLCAPRAATFEGEGRLFLDNVKHCHALLTGKLGKRVMMWDDMFEYYQNILEEIPRDVVMVSWQYQDDVRSFRGHFSNLIVSHPLETYRRLGFDVVIAPSDYSSANVRTFTEYARPFEPLGGLVTAWEKSRCFMSKSMATVAYAGHLWNNPENRSEDTLAAMTLKVFGVRDERLVNVIRTCVESRITKEINLQRGNLLCRSSFGLNHAEFAAKRLLKDVLSEQKAKIDNSRGLLILRDWIASTQYDILHFRLKKAIWTLAETRLLTDELRTEFENLDGEIAELAEARLETWREIRGGLDSTKMVDKFRQHRELINSLPQEILNGGLLKLRFCLPDKYSRQSCQISLKTRNGWQRVAEGVFKNPDNEDAFFERLFVIAGEMKPEAVRLEASGCGGIGICRVSAVTNAGEFMPSKTLAVEGKALNPEHVLDDDCKWCFLGEKNSTRTFRDRALAQATHAAEFALAHY